MTRIEEVIHEHLANAGQDKLEAVFHAIDDNVRIQCLTSAVDDLMVRQAAFEAKERRMTGAIEEALAALVAGDSTMARVILKGALK